jgi:predicted enzyme related to lactoylglutathione lyase
MSVRLNVVTVVVDDYENALKFYTDVLGFEKRTDMQLGPASRWLTVAAPGQDVEILLQKPDPAVHGAAHAKRLSERVGEGTTWVLATDDCHASYELLRSRGARFTEAPKEVPWGTQAVLKDLYGNTFALVQLHSAVVAA